MTPGWAKGDTLSNPKTMSPLIARYSLAPVLVYGAQTTAPKALINCLVRGICGSTDTVEWHQEARLAYRRTRCRPVRSPFFAASCLSN